MQIQRGDMFEEYKHNLVGVKGKMTQGVIRLKRGKS
jgi:hypothetical protein